VVTPNPITTPFPTPPGGIRRALELLNIRRRDDAEEMAESDADLTDLPRPWEPASCDDDLRESVWEWCDAVATWINHEYAWRPTQMIPPCWLRHRHIARELPVLAILRWIAEESFDPGPIEEWHRYTLPTFHERMTARLGESSCRTGTHLHWPAEARHSAHTNDAAVHERQNLIYADTRPDADHSAEPATTAEQHANT